MQTALAATEKVRAPVDTVDDPDAYGEIELAEEQTGPHEQIRAAMRALSQAAEGIERLRWRYIELDLLLRHVKSEGNSRQLIQQIHGVSKPAHDLLKDVHRILMTAAYPYEHTDGKVTVSQFCSRRMPTPNNPRSVHLWTKVTLSGVYGLYLRLLGDIADWAEQAEKTMGLEPVEMARVEVEK
jgi:hypothetical protein